MFFDLNAYNQSNYSIYWTSMPIIHQPIPYNWTSILIISQTIPYNWTSMPPTSQSEKLLSLCLCRSRRGFCLGKIDISGILRHAYFQKCVYFDFRQLFQKWLPRANHYAHETRGEILSRTPVSILQDLSPRPQNHRKTSGYSFLA